MITWFGIILSCVEMREITTGCTVLAFTHYTLHTTGSPSEKLKFCVYSSKKGFSSNHSTVEYALRFRVYLRAGNILFGLLFRVISPPRPVESQSYT
jgi:hypothetical protein